MKKNGEGDWGCMSVNVYNQTIRTGRQGYYKLYVARVST